MESSILQVLHQLQVRVHYAQDGRLSPQGCRLFLQQLSPSSAFLKNPVCRCLRSTQSAGYAIVFSLLEEPRPTQPAYGHNPRRSSDCRGHGSFGNGLRLETFSAGLPEYPQAQFPIKEPFQQRLSNWPHCIHHKAEHGPAIPGPGSEVQNPVRNQMIRMLSKSNQHQNPAGCCKLNADNRWFPKFL